MAHPGPARHPAGRARRRHLTRGRRRTGPLLLHRRPHTLTSRLRRFEAYGIVTRSVHAEVPPRVEYELTPLGQRLRTVLDAMAEWGVTVRDPHLDDPAPDDPGLGDAGLGAPPFAHPHPGDARR
ncbi:winged helix-turn-helix transcriptional regulator [Streptomyces caniscabiei]|uniref:winged helix-turn-helix transcriptional regulator n=1 Tax=Streptomyces caniscabiei TaxID=2746961 RepID=UPI00187301CE|nr:helix-turn-helix transcriptional regulator [Streptomyces caniscabiei]MBE4756025.1 helix-turn-helix transcriptional regulator [Streptomyces caniscabiei]MBE4769957.1 helix-turn-helix transcriptional regulator [Streptomyces caniscabiei]MBE4787096.1 helix-turn-helix transcriptional regulator [Streptomyces caniscabiei]MBE4795499.1 helix-turn-helix transcriptional regulator [Streptomyces caniscabiei]